MLGLRPEHLQPASDDAATPLAQFEATLEVVEPVGNEIFLNLHFGNDALVARIAPRTLPEPGGRMRMEFDPARLHVFDANSGRRIDATGDTMHSARSCV